MVNMTNCPGREVLSALGIQIFISEFEGIKTNCLFGSETEPKHAN